MPEKRRENVVQKMLVMKADDAVRGGAQRDPGFMFVSGVRCEDKGFFLPLQGPATPSEVGVLVSVFFCSFDFCRDRQCRGTRKCPHRVSSDKLLRSVVPSQWRNQHW